MAVAVDQGGSRPGSPRWLERAARKVFVNDFEDQGDGVHGRNLRIEQGDGTLLAPDAPLHSRNRMLDPLRDAGQEP